MPIEEKDPPGNCISCNAFMEESHAFCEVCSKPVCEEHVRHDSQFECTYCPKCYQDMLDDGA